MRVILLHVGGNVATIYNKDTTFRVFVNKQYHRAFSELEDARWYALKVLSVMDGELSDDE